MVIVAILGSTVISQLFDTQVFQERGYIDEIASTTRYARKIAIASGCQTSVTLTPLGYSAAQRSTFNNCNNVAAPWATPVRRTDGSMASGTAPQNVALAPNAIIIFNPDGTIFGPNPPVISSGLFTLTIDSDSGRVAVLP
jgi:MSHA pilin protein MshC